MRKGTNIKKVLVAMSGGVDSSVATALLKQEGYDVIGITMNLSCANKSSDKGCCGFDAAADAKIVADKLAIPHYVINFKKEFEEYVIKNFIDEYKAGHTPNPCVRCNQFIKFDLLLQKAKELGAKYVATGHYARIKPLSPIPFPLVKGEGKKRVRGLFKGKDTNKDQSYFLYTITQDILAHTLFPIGEMTKPKVRKIAKDLNLPVHDKKESQEICFIEDDNYSKFLKENAPEVVKPGNIVDKEGNLIGQHNGIAFYTIGQRKGIGAHKEKLYVVKIDARTNTIYIGPQKEAFGKILTAANLSFTSGIFPSEPLEISAKIRYNSPGAKAVLSPIGTNTARVEFGEPQLAITSGQSVVFYKGDEVLGGGIIE